MKKTVVLTAIFSSYFAVSYAQQTNMVTSPVYDNTRQEHLIMHENTPKDMEKYSLIDNSTVHNSSWPANKFTLTGNKKTDKSLFKIDPTGFGANPAPYDIKKVTFPKTKNYLINQ